MATWIDKDTGIEYKKCGGKCKRLKVVTEFYTDNGSKDGYHTRCKDCHKEAMRNQRNSRKMPKSTLDGIEILGKMGIPAHPGVGIGKPWVDLVAWGCIPIEPKGANKNKQGSFQWGFTPRQRKKLLEDIQDGFLLLIANNGSGKRKFIVPASNDWLVGKFRKGITALTVSLDSDHGNANSWSYLKKFENAFHLIEQARTKISFELSQSFDNGEDS